MSLLHWFPLNGDLKDYGEKPLTMTINSPSVVNNASGKIGQCYYNTNNNGGCVSTTTTSLGTNLSMFAWVKPTSFQSSSSLGGGVVGTHRYSTNSGMGITFKYVTSSTAYLSVNTGNGSSRTYNTYCGSTLLNANTWYHVGFTYDGSKIRFYVNGVLDGTSNYTGMYVPEDYLTLGCWSLSGSTGGNRYSGYLFLGYINDVRVYNHVLSAKEVKEISKGLVLHYNFEDPWIEPTTNVLAGKSLGFGNRWTNVTTYPDGYTPKDRVLKRVTNDPYFGYANTFLTDVGSPSVWAGKYITLSCWYYRATSTDPKISMDVYASNGTTNYNSCTTSVSSTNLNVVGVWTKAIIIRRFKTDMSAYTKLTYIPGCSGGNNADTLYMADPQIEIKDHATPYVSGTRSVGTVYDNSGYGYNGTAFPDGTTGNLPITTNSGIGKYSMYFRGNNTAVQTPDLSTLIHDGNYTIACWFMHTDEWCTRSYETIYGGPSGFEIEMKNSTTNSPLLYAFSWNKGSVAYSLNEWHQFVMTRTTSGTVWYLDGVQAFTGTAGSIPSGDYFIGAWKTNAQQNYRGYVADFKIFATALSADDILAEYQRKAAIDKSGNLFTGEFIEDNVNVRPRIYKTNIVSVSTLSENETANNKVKLNNDTIEADEFVEL